MTTRPDPPLDVLVVGAGISGLTAAFHLARGGLRVAVCEASARVGGAIETREEGGFRFELGPNTVLDRGSAMGELIAAAGLDDERLEATPDARRRYLWKGGALHALPAAPPGFLATPLFSLRAKLRLLREPWIGRRRDGDEESIAEFVRRRLGPELLDYAVGPFVSGVYAGDPARLSVRWATPKIAELERRYGSLLRGALARRKGPAPGGAMISFREGLEELPRRLAEVLEDVRTGVTVHRVVPTPEGFRAETDSGVLTARSAVIAVPADAAAAILADATEGASRLLAEVPYAPVVVVGLGVRRSQVGHPLDGFGFLAPRVEALRILGCLFPSSLFPGRAPNGCAALTAFAGGRTDPEIVELEEKEIVERVLADLSRALDLRGEPLAAVVRRWPRAIPQYELGHGRFVERVREIEERLPGLRIGASYVGGVSVADCIASAATLAREMLERPPQPASERGK